MKTQLKQTAYIFLTALILCAVSCSDNISGKLALPENGGSALKQPQTPKPQPPQEPSNPPASEKKPYAA